MTTNRWNLSAKTAWQTLLSTTGIAPLRTSAALSSATLAFGLLMLPPLAAQQSPPNQPAEQLPAEQHEEHHHHDHGKAEKPADDDSKLGHEEGHHHDFSDAERWFHIFEEEGRDDWQKPKTVVKLLDLRPGMTVADIGAGTGYFLPHLAEAVGPEGHVLGLDPEATLVTFMAERAQKQGWSQVEARRIPFDAPELAVGSVDRLLIVNTWHHIDDRGPYGALLRRALAPGGFVLVVDYTKDSPHGPPVEHRLPPEKVIAELALGGLEATVLEEDLPLQYVVLGRRPADATAELLAADRAFAAAVAQQGVEAWADWFAKDGSMFPPGHSPVTGRQSIRSLMEPVFAAPGFSLTWDPQGADIAASGDLGFTYGSSLWTRKSEEGVETKHEGRYLTVWRRQADGTWRVAGDLGN
jgi:ketosteroid isomerase-like protein/ubiquinone/menaquinone biosynthesis C-methylase UbiE